MVFGDRPVMELVNEVESVPLFVQLLAVVGLADVLQQTPLAVIAYGLEMLLPPLVAVVVVIPVISAVVIGNNRTAAAASMMPAPHSDVVQSPAVDPVPVGKERAVDCRMEST